MNNTVLKVLGIGAAVAGAGISLLANFVSEKQTDAKIAEKVAEAVAQATSKES